MDFFAEGKLTNSFDILVSNLDYDLYDSYWLRHLRYFRPIIGKEKVKKTELEKIIEQLNEYAEKYRQEQLGKKSRVKNSSVKKK